MPSWKKIVLSGSDAALNSLVVTNGITGSLLGTASWAQSASQAISSSFATTASFALNALVFPYTGSARITGSLGVTGSVSVLSGSLNIINQSGYSVLDTTTLTLNDNSGVTTISWGNGLLTYVGVTSLDWSNRLLIDSSGTTGADWTLRYLYDSSGTSISTDWSNRYLYDSSGTSISIDWGNRYLYDSSGTNISTDWQNRRMFDTLGSSSVFWNSRVLYDSNNADSIDWNSRRLLDSSGNSVLSWQSRTFNGTSSLATLAISASYTTGSNAADYPIAVFNGPTNTNNSGSFIVGTASRPLYFNPGSGVLTAVTFSGSLSGTASFATTASYVNTLSQSVLITGSLVVTGSVRGQVIDITPNNQTASLNCASGNMFTLTLSSSVNTVLTASNIQPGQAINLRIVQPNPSGSLSYGSQFKFSSGFAYTASTTSSVTDIVSFLTFDTSSLFGTSIRNFV